MTIPFIEDKAFCGRAFLRCAKRVMKLPRFAAFLVSDK
jgi:hypothetical protein